MKDIDGLMGSYKKKRKDLWLHFWCSPQCFCCCAFSYNPSCLHLPPITCFIVVLTIVTAQIKQHSKWNIANPMLSVFVLFIFVTSQIVSSASKSGWDFFFCHASLSDRQKNQVSWSRVKYWHLVFSFLGHLSCSACCRKTKYVHEVQNPFSGRNEVHLCLEACS